MMISNKKRLHATGVIFFAIIFVIAGSYIYNHKKAIDARNLEYEAYKAYFQQKFSLAGDLFIKAYDKKKNISYLLNAGYAYDSAGQPEKAINCLSRIAGMGDEAFSNLAKFKMAMIYLKNNDRALAVKILKEILNEKSPVMKDIALYEMARIYGETDKTESQKYYQEIINKFPSSPLVDSAKMELQKLQKN